MVFGSRSDVGDLSLIGFNSMTTNNSIRISQQNPNNQVVTVTEQQNLQVYYYEEQANKLLGNIPRYSATIEDKNMALVVDSEKESVKMDASRKRRSISKGELEGLPSGDFDIVYLRIQGLSPGSTRILFTDNSTGKVTFTTKLAVKMDEELRKNAPQMSVDPEKHRYRNSLRVYVD
jgi:hypothetical protein